MLTDKDTKNGKSENGFEFTLQSKSDKKWNITFAADSEDDKTNWLDAINVRNPRSMGCMSVSY